MPNEQTQFNPKLRSYHVLLLACLLSPLLIYNSNYVNSQRAKEKLNKEKGILFDRIISSRYLEENENEEASDSDKVCEKASKELVDYYKTGDLKKIDIDDGKIKSEDKGKPYFDALINIIKSLTGDDDDDEDTDSGNNSWNYSGDETNRRNLEESEDLKDDIITYVKHLIPILIFFAIGILSLPGWFVCCICTCCNCCCCCCCKNLKCKIPCFIFTYVFYALAIAICIYGFSQTNKNFEGIANTECSILKFLDQVLDGETKQELPRWAGIEGINQILENLHDSINDMKNGTYEQLESQIDTINDKKVEFLGLMETADQLVYNKNSKTYNYLTNNYNYQFSNNLKVEGQYVLDLVNMFGIYNAEEKKFEPPNSTLDAWEFEYKTVSQIADEYLGQAKDGFNEILSSSTDEILDSLNSGIDSLSDIRESFDDIRSGSIDSIYDVYDDIDKYGKLGSKLVFGVLGLMIVALAVLMLFICLFSGEMCKNCCCCRCILKFFTHLLWNILALLMFITFLVGFLFSFIGTLGEDAMSVVSYVVSEENLGVNGTDGEGIFVSSLEDAKNYLSRCINGDGKIEEEIGLNLDQINSFDNISEAEAIIEDTKNEFEEKKQFVTYNIYKAFMEKRSNLSAEELFLLPKNKNFNDEDKSNFLLFKVLLEEMNGFIKNNAPDSYKEEKWETKDYDETKTCASGTDPSSLSGSIVFNPLKCKPIDRDWISQQGVDIKGRAQILSDTIDIINALNNPYLKQLDDLKVEYEEYLESYIGALGFFNNTIKSITNSIREYIGNGTSLFGFIQCNFIGTNLKIMLKYLKKSLGTNIKTLGICLTIVGCSLALSISSTILLIVIINEGLKEKHIDQILPTKADSFQ